MINLITLKPIKLKNKSHKDPVNVIQNKNMYIKTEKNE